MFKNLIAKLFPSFASQKMHMDFSKPQGQVLGAGAIPTNTPSPTPSIPPLPIRISVPSDEGDGEKTLPTNIATALYKAFDPYGEATNAARVLHHPMQVSGTPDEIADGYNHWGNRGENPSFRTNAVNKNADGSLDRGLMQINSNTFAGMQGNPYWNNALKRRGITSYDQMDNPFLNALTGMLILMRGNYDTETGGMMPAPRNYRQWYGAPADLRY